MSIRGKYLKKCVHASLTVMNEHLQFPKSKIIEKTLCFILFFERRRFAKWSLGGQK